MPKNSLSKKRGFPPFRTKKPSSQLQESILRTARNDQEHKYLSLSNQSFSSTLLASLLDAIQANTVLTSINLSDNQLQDSNICELFKRLHLSGNTNLHSINIRNNQISSVGTKSLIEYIRNHLHITKCTFDDDIPSLNETTHQPPTPSQLRKIHHLLESNNKMWKFLKNETSRFECQGRAIVVLQGFILPEWKERMTSLDMTNNNLFHISNVLQGFSNLTELILSHNELTKLPRWISSLSQLRLLDASNNDIRVVPGELSKLSKLETLNLSSNNISYVPLFLGTLSELKILNMESNPVMNIPRQLIDGLDHHHGDQELFDYLIFITDLLASHLLLQSASIDERTALSSKTMKRINKIQSKSNLSDESLEKILLSLSQDDVQVINRRKNFLYHLGEEIDLNSSENHTKLLKSEISNSLRFSSNLEEKRESGSESENSQKSEDDFVRDFLCTELQPSVSSACRVLKRISDTIWSGLEDGSFRCFDTRTTGLIRTKKGGNSPVSAILNVPKHFQIWTADLAGQINVNNLKNGKSEYLLLSRAEIGAISAMVLLEDHVWISYENHLAAISVVNPSSLERKITLGSEITTLQTMKDAIWAGTSSGCIYVIMNREVVSQFQAHSSPITSMSKVSDRMWTSSESDQTINIWNQVNLNKNSLFISCLYCLQAPESPLPLYVVAHPDNGGAYSISGTGVHHWSANGILKNSLITKHHTSISSACFSVSPDRLWTGDLDGKVCYLELKRGKKTIQRLKTQYSNEDSEILGIILNQPNAVEYKRSHKVESDEDDTSPREQK